MLVDRHPARRRTDDLADLRRGSLRIFARCARRCLRGCRLSGARRGRTSRFCGIRRFSRLSRRTDGRFSRRLPFSLAFLRNCVKENVRKKACLSSARRGGASFLSSARRFLVRARLGRISRAGVLDRLLALSPEGCGFRILRMDAMSENTQKTSHTSILTKQPIEREIQSISADFDKNINFLLYPSLPYGMINFV